MATPKKEKEQQPWQLIPEEVYKIEADKLIHFSAKIVNSNADDFGVRLGQEHRLRMSYVSARCLIHKDVMLELDYAKNPSASTTDLDPNIKVADVFKQIRRLQTHEPEAEAAEGGHAETLRQILSSTLAETYASSSGLQNVSPRMRQLLLPRDGDYVSITPLPSAGLSREINRRIHLHNDTAKQNLQLRKIRDATLGVGGSNPQNVGSLVRETQTAWTFGSPTENRAIRTALAIHYNGIAIRLPHQAMQAWKDWRTHASVKNQDRLPTDMHSREQEQKLVLNIAKGILLQGHKALRLLEREKQLFDDVLLSETLQDNVIRALIDPNERGKSWPRAFGERVAKIIGDYKTGQDQSLFLPLDDGSLHRIARWIEEYVR
jgi:hypothetical protein